MQTSCAVLLSLWASLAAAHRNYRLNLSEKRVKWKISKSHLHAPFSLSTFLFEFTHFYCVECKIWAHRKDFYFFLADQNNPLLLPRKPQWSPVKLVIWLVKVYLYQPFVCCRCTKVILLPQFHLVLLSLSGCADVESLSQRSSDEENEEKEEESKTTVVTSMDEALRTVNAPADYSPEDFLKQNFEALAESCSTGTAPQTLARTFK